MRLLILALSAVLLGSCEPNIVSKKVKVTYYNGDVDTISIKYDDNAAGTGIYLHDGCIYLSLNRTSGKFYSSAACGVRTFKRLRHE